MTSAAATHLAIDLGASSGRVMAGRFSGQRIELQEAHRFDNGPVHVQDHMHWDVLALWRAILEGLQAAAADRQVASVGVDTWGVDYVLLDKNDDFVAPAFHYRDRRTRGMFEEAFARVPREEIFEATGLQFMEINTLYQLLAARLAGSPALDAAARLLMMPDLFHWLLTGEKSNEYTNASTTQMLDPRSGGWATGLVEALELPSRILGTISKPGTVLGPVQPSVAAATGLGEVPVVLPATHDTGSAVIAVPATEFAPAQPDWCYISSGTWSLMGCELAEPRIDARCSDLNFTNEGGAAGSTRLLKNIGGLWLFQQCRESFVRRGREMTWEAMVAAASAAPPLSLLLDPDAPDFLAPDDMIDAISGYVERTGQTLPERDGTILRATLEGLALRYRKCLGSLEELVGRRIETIHIVGGGSKNTLLCQMAADACDRQVLAGPVEATALGNVAMQMLGLGQIGSIGEAREIIRQSFPLQRFEPQDPAPWNEAAERFDQLAVA